MKASSCPLEEERVSKDANTPTMNRFEDQSIDMGIM